MKREIKNRWSGVVIYSGEVNTIAELVVQNKANLRYADLSGANLSRVNLRRANLRGADLRYAKQRVIRIVGSVHEINAIGGEVSVGCIRKPIAEWLETFQEVGVANGYTPEQVTEYGMHLRHIAALMAIPWGKDQESK